MVLPVLIGLGVWQLQRMHWKDTMLHAIAAAGDKPALHVGTAPIPADAAFRQIEISLDCPVQEPAAEAGRNMAGQPGWAFSLDCRSGRQKVRLAVGWHDRADGWRHAALPAGVVSINGLAVPGSGASAAYAWRVTASSAPPPLVPVAPPTPADIPNNHFAYAIQWFAFAAVLLAIYALLVRRWRLASPPHKE